MTMNIPKECKRLAEVDFPIAEVSKHAVREKSIRHGHPSTLHLWWARRPLASCRAMLMALLFPDPVDEHCPEEFRQEARRILLGMSGRPQGWDDLLTTDLGLRKGMQLFFKLRRPPLAKQMFKRAEPWRPWRTVATWYIWRGFDLLKN